MPMKTYSPGQFQVPPKKAADGMLRDRVDDTVSPAPAHLPGNSVAENILLPINYDYRYGKLPWDNDPKMRSKDRGTDAILHTWHCRQLSQEVSCLGASILNRCVFEEGTVFSTEYFTLRMISPFLNVFPLVFFVILYISVHGLLLRLLLSLLFPVPSPGNRCFLRTCHGDASILLPSPLSSLLLPQTQLPSALG